MNDDAQQPSKEILEVFEKHKIQIFRISENESFNATTVWTKPAMNEAARADFRKAYGTLKAIEFRESFFFGDTSEGDTKLCPDKKPSTRRAPMTKDEYMVFHKECCDKMVEITRAKNADYTGGSGDPFANFQQIGNLIQLPSVVEIGFLTRMSDKFSRIGSFVTKGKLQVKDEGVADSLLDLANYCILFAGYLKSKEVSQ